MLLYPDYFKGLGLPQSPVETQTLGLTVLLVYLIFFRILATAKKKKKR